MQSKLKSSEGSGRSLRAQRANRTPEPVVGQTELSAQAPWETSVAADAPGPTAEQIIEILEPLALERRLERIRSVVDERIGSVTVVMDETHDPHNGAAILRSCDAFGIQEAHVVPQSAEEGFQVGSRVAQGAQRWVDVVQHATSKDLAAHLQDRGFELIATHPEGSLVPEDLASIPKFALVMGNEREGISRALTEASTRSVRIPMRGFVESLNVSVSAALLVRAAVKERTGDLSEAARRRLYATGLFHTVPRAAEVLAAALERDARSMR